MEWELISLRLSGIQPLYELRGLADQPSFDEVRKIISKTVEMYQNELFDELYVCYNHHVNTLTSQMRVEQMLPIVDLDPNEADDSYSLTFELETSREEIFGAVVASVCRKYDLRGYYRC